MPTTPGMQDQGGLPNVRMEADLLAGLLPAPTLLIEDPSGLTDRIPTRDAVLAGLSEAGIVHLTCHASSDPGDPSRSQIYLHDHQENPFTVATLLPARLRHAQLAFLSACQTARNESLDLIDEGIHLTSAFQLAGFPYVIGTMWPIRDSVAVRVAERFYSRLVSGPGAMDVSASAQALHDTVREQRDRYVYYPSLWAAYLHAGA
jgi:CHAT domain-containing protein